MKRSMVLAAILALALTVYAMGDVPRTISYQGVLKDDAGVIVPDDDYDFIFRIYDVSSGGTALWTESRTKHVTAGILNVILGEIDPIDLPFDAPYWLGVTIGAGDELAPRTPLTGSPYALNALAVIGSHNVFPDSGAVGVGTAEPDRALHVVSPDIHVMEVEGTAGGAWALLDINASGLSANPGIEFLKQGALKAVTYVGLGDDLVFRVGADDALRLEAGTANCGIGVADPVERLDVAGAVRLGTTGESNAGTIRWTGTDFEGYDGGTWLSLTSSGGGTLPSGSLGQTIRHNGSDWVSSSFLYNNGDRIGIGTTIPSAELEVMGDNMMNHFKLSASTGAGPALYLNAVNKDWTIYGSNPGSSAGDQKLVFRDFSAARDRMVIDADGDVGIGTTEPDASLHLLGGNWDLIGTEGDLKIGNDDYRLKIGVATGGGGAGSVGIRVQGGLERLILGAGEYEVLTVRPLGQVDIGSPTLTGYVDFYHNGYPDPALHIFSDGYGGGIQVMDEANGRLVTMKGNDNDTGGSIILWATAFNPALYLDGNADGAGNPQIYMQGTSNVAAFRMELSGDDAVYLPASSVSPYEIRGETGCASVNEYDETGPGLSGTGVDVLASRSITVQHDGWALVIGSAQVTIAHTNGLMSNANFGVSDDYTAFPACQDVRLLLSSNMPSGSYDFPVSNQSLFELDGAGTYTFYYLGEEVTGTFSVFDVQLSIVFMPTAYGMVSPPAAGSSAEGGDAPLRTTSDIEAERSEAAAFERDRVERELERIRREIEELKRSIPRSDESRTGTE